MPSRILNGKYLKRNFSCILTLKIKKKMYVSVRWKQKILERQSISGTKLKISLIRQAREMSHFARVKPNLQDKKLPIGSTGFLLCVRRQRQFSCSSLFNIVTYHIIPYDCKCPESYLLLLTILNDHC